MKKILLAYYTQTGQLKNIADSIIKELKSDENYQIDYIKITPKNDFNFPWSDDKFYDVMPESVMGITIPLNKIDTIENDYDLVFLAYQVWFLHPSVPFWSFLENDKVKTLLKNKNVITILGIRNMWVNAHNRVSAKLKELKANHVGNIVFEDPNPNLISVLTVLKFATSGKIKPYKILPAYGVPKKNIDSAQQYGTIIKHALEQNNFTNLQAEIFKNKGVAIHFPLVVTELAASKIFKKWALFVLKKGQAKNPARKSRLAIYKIYLLVLIFIISPISSTIFFITNILFYPLTSKMIKRIALMN